MALLLFRRINVKSAEHVKESEAAASIGDPAVVHSEAAGDAVADAGERREVAPAHVESDDREEAGYGYGV
jgi:hypothetical protein